MRGSTITAVNGIDTEVLRETMDEISKNPARGRAEFDVTTTWKGGTRSETSIHGWKLGGHRLEKRFSFSIDEPPELLGGNTAPNPQEYLMGAVNACMMASFVSACAMQHIELHSLSVETHGELDLRGFLGLDRKVKPGYDGISCVFRVKGTGTPEQYDRIKNWVMDTSPNYWNLANPVKVDLIVKEA